MRLTASALAALMAMGAGAWAQTTDEATADDATAPAAGEDGAAGGEATAEDGTPLLLPGEEEAEGEGVATEGGDPAEDAVDTDVTATGDALRMDGTVPVDASPEAEDGEGAITATEGGSPAGEAVGETSADVPTDVTAEDEAMSMDGTVPVDESPEAEGEPAGQD